MKRNSFFSLMACIIITASPSQRLHAEGILDEPVPWSGSLRKYSIAELVARMSGWADASGKGEFELAKPLPEEISAAKLDRFDIKENPRPTYREVLTSALESARQRALLEETDKGILVIYVYARSYSLSGTTREALLRKGRLSLEGIEKDLAEKGWRLSEHVTLRYFGENSILLVNGTEEDIAAVSRYFGVK